MSADVSVIIPFYSRIDWLIEAVESVLSQTISPSEIIVINDGSREDIRPFLELYGDKVVYIEKENGGAASARNMGIERSRGEFIAFLDSDDIWSSKKLEIQVNRMMETGVVWSHTSYETFHTNKKTNNTCNTISVDKFNGVIFPKMLYSNPLATPTIMIRGDFLRNNMEYRFDTSTFFGEDQFLWLNIAERNDILAINEVLCRVRLRGSNAARSARAQIHAKDVIYRNFVVKNKKQGILPIYINFAYKFCVRFNKILSKLESGKLGKRTVEIISRIAYLIPFCMFKMEYRKYKY